MSASSLSSGDLLADRRYAYAMAAAKEADHEAAADLLAQTLEIVPDWAPPWPEGLRLARLPLPGRRQYQQALTHAKLRLSTHMHTCITHGSPIRLVPRPQLAGPVGSARHEGRQLRVVGHRERHVGAAATGHSARH